MLYTDELSPVLRSTDEILSSLRILPEKKKRGTRKYRQLNRPLVISSEEWIELEKMDQMEKAAKERLKEANKLKILQRKTQTKCKSKPAKSQPKKRKPESEGSEIDDDLETIDKNLQAKKSVHPSQKEKGRKISKKNIKAVKSTAYKVGMWAIVTYDNFSYPGKIIKIVNEQYEVSVMHSVYYKGQKVWRWPESNKADIFLYDAEDIVEVIVQPEIVTDKGRGAGLYYNVSSSKLA